MHHFISKLRFKEIEATLYINFFMVVNERFRKNNERARTLNEELILKKCFALEKIEALVLLNGDAHTKPQSCNVRKGIA